MYVRTFGVNIEKITVKVTKPVSSIGYGYGENTIDVTIFIDIFREELKIQQENI